jgi:Tfp pilus assembly protein PilO
MADQHNMQHNPNVDYDEEEPKESKSSSNVWGFKVNRELSLFSIIQIMIVTGSIMFGIFTYINKIDTAQTEIAALRFDMNQQFNGIRTDIVNLPDVRAELVQIEKRLDQADNRAANESARLEEIQQMAIQNKADILNILRSSAAQVGRNVK